MTRCKGTPDTISFRLHYRPPVKSYVILCRANQISPQMTGMLRFKGRQRKQNRTPAGMSTKSDFIHTINVTNISANPTHVVQFFPNSMSKYFKFHLMSCTFTLISKLFRAKRRSVY